MKIKWWDYAVVVIIVGGGVAFALLVFAALRDTKQQVTTEVWCTTHGYKIHGVGGGTICKDETGRLYAP